MYRKIRKWGRRFIPVLTLSLLCQNLGITGNSETVKAADNQISISAEQIKAKNANSHGAELAVDGNSGTYWQSIPSNGEGDSLKRMYDHNHYIDITLDGTYNLSQIKIFNLVNDTYNNYYVYASVDGENYDKIISKTSDAIATAEGDSYTLDNVSAAYLRLNMAYNSNAFATNLSEIEVYGTKISDTVGVPSPIEVEDWEDSKWKTEWDKFESDQTYANQKVLNEMSNLVGRVLGDQWKKYFRFEIRNTLEEGKDIFEIKDGADSTIVIRGNSGIAMASGFNYYLKNYVNIDYNPMYASNTALDELKPVGDTVVKEAQFDVRYALNFCTYSYTMAFWNWDEYEEFLDWCAMNGINLVLDIVGQEEVLRQTLLEFNYTDEEIKDYICGPAYFAWFYMQNLYSVGGPLPNAWFEQRTELGRQIHDRMQTYGITPVMQGFSGQVPETFAEKNENAVLVDSGDWSGFTRPKMIKTYLADEDKKENGINYFPTVAEAFYNKQKNLFGNISHYYATDPFHEGTFPSDLDVGSIFLEVQNEMLKSDKDAIWVMQQWQGNLGSESKPGNAQKISKIDCSRILVLDLVADMNPEHDPYIEGNDTSWLYCMLHDFGGRMGLDGEIPVIASDPIETFQNTNDMKGIGITAEALENSPVVYELLFDTNWSKDPIDYYAWLKKYSERRAGGESESLWKAWKILLNTAYADKGTYYQGAAETVINIRPKDDFVPGGYQQGASRWGHSTIYYDRSELDQALLLLAENYEAFQASPAFQYDLADVAEQVLCNAASEYYLLMIQAMNEGNLQEFEKISTSFLDLIDLSDQILSTTDEFMLGTWIEASRKMITDADDWTKDLFEFNARSLVTTWAGERPCDSGELRDYSNRKWAGLTSSFYKERWEIWIRNRIADLKGEARSESDAKAESNWFLWEYQWVNRKSDDDNGKYAFETIPSGANLAELAQQAFEKFSYTNLAKNTGGTAQEIENIAKGKTVTTTSSTQSGTLSNITDDDAGTVWSAEGAGPHTIELDLEKTYNVSKIMVSGPQRAGNIPYKWKVEYYNPYTAAWILLKENENYAMSSNTEIDTSAECVASKVRVTIETEDAKICPVEIVEIAVNGTEAETYENLAKGITPVSNRSSSSDSSLTALTDGNISSLWKTAGNDYPVEVEITLPEISYADSVEVYFEYDQTPFQFYATVTDEDGNETKISPQECENHTNVLEQISYTMDVKKNISKVKVVLIGSTGQGIHSGFWPALAEVKVMGTPPVSQNEPDVDLTGKNISGVMVSGGGATDNVIDGNKESYDIVSINQEITFDLNGTYYVSHVNFTFEKGELSLNYQIQAEDASGNRIVLADVANNQNVFTSSGDAKRYDLKVPVHGDINKIIFIHKGNSGSGPAYLANTALYEFEACGVEKTDSSSITVNPAAAQDLLNGNAEYTAAANTPITLTLNKAEDVNMIRILRGANETEALKYKAEYYDEETGEWKEFIDLSDNQNAGSESCAVADGIVFTKQIRVTFTKDVTLSGISLYITDYEGILSDRINQIRTILNGVTYGESKGQYKQEAKTTAEAVLKQAENATGITSQTIDEWLDMVNDALDNFYETGMVYLDRNGLLLAMAEAKELIEKQTKYDLTTGQDALQEAYETARGIYETYDLTQTELDAAAAALNSKIKEIKDSVGAEIDQREIADAKTDLGNLIEQEENKGRNKRDYTAVSWREYEEALAAVNAIREDANATQEAIAAAKFRLQQAILGLENSDGTVFLVESIILKATKTDLTVGESVQISADIRPAEADDQTLSWVSDHESIAAITSTDQDQNTCLVTARAEGTVKITAQAQDGSDVTGEITLKITKPESQSQPSTEFPTVGRIYRTSTLEYKITASSESLKTVIVQKSLKKNAKKIVIPPTVNIDGFDYQVTEIKAKAFNKNKKITQVTIGTNIKTIGKKAFNRCNKLKKVTITSSVITSIGKKSFAGIQKNAKITVPKAKWKTYKNYFKKAKTAATVKIAKK